MIISIVESSIIIEEEKKYSVNSGLQYSLTLIEASLEYLRMVNAEVVSEKKSTIMRKLISLKYFDEINKLFCSKEMLKELLKDHERIISQLRKNFEKYRDKDEASFITSVIEKNQRMAKKLRKYF